MQYKWIKNYLEKIKCISNQNGQGLIEYLIIVCLVCVASVSILRVLGQNVTAKFSQVSNTLQGKSANHGGVRMDEVRETHYQKRDLSNFFQGAAQREKNE
jgi:Flp pilus assembly pilin Flp